MQPSLPPSLSADVMGMLLNPCIPVNALVFPIVCVAGSARDGQAIKQSSY